MKRAIEPKGYFLASINPVVRFLIISDIAIIGAGGLLAPMFALFIEDFIIGSNEMVVGLAAGIFLFTKSLVQIPAAHFIDRILGEKDDFYILFIATFITALIPLSYLFINTPEQLYAVQFIYGIVTAFTFPSFMALFTHHIDKGREGTEWGVYFTLTDLTSAVFAALSGYLALTYGFHGLIIGVSILMVAGALFLLPIRHYIRKR